jgi:polygalacturonase
MWHRRHVVSGLLAGAVASGVSGARPLNDAGMVDVRRFGAKGDGKSIDSPAINAAIAYAAQRGGGTVVVPAGTYLIYSIRLQSNITLHLGAGSILLAADGLGYDVDDDPPPSYAAFQDHGHAHWRNAMIWGIGLHDVRIEGPGLIWGKGLGRGHDYDVGRPVSGKPGVGDKAIALKLCRNVTLRDFRMLEAGWFGILATGVDNMVIDGLLIDTNRDGIDLDCCRNVVVNNCHVNSPWDDAICPKSSYALGYPAITENITISNCIVSGSYKIGSVLDGTFQPFPPAPKSTHGRIKLGTESNGGFRNLTITNCVFDICRGIALETVDGGILEDITISNISMRNVTTAPIFMRLGARLRGPVGSKPGTLRRIVISNVTSSNAHPMPSIIAGLPDYPVEDVMLDNLHLEQQGGVGAMALADPPEREAAYPEPDMFGLLPATGFFMRHVRHITMRNVAVVAKQPDSRPALWLSDVAGFDGFGLRLPGEQPFAVQNVSNFRCSGLGGRTEIYLGSQKDAARF